MLYYNYGISNISNDDRVNIFMYLLNIHAPSKHKYTSANDNPFITKDVRKAIMSRSNLRIRQKRQRNILIYVLDRISLIQ